MVPKSIGQQESFNFDNVKVPKEEYPLGKYGTRGATWCLDSAVYGIAGIYRCCDGLL